MIRSLWTNLAWWQSKPWGLWIWLESEDWHHRGAEFDMRVLVAACRTVYRQTLRSASQQHAVMQGALKASGWCGLHECDLNAEGLNDFFRLSPLVVCFDCSAIFQFCLRSNDSMKPLQHIIAHYLPRMLGTLHLELRQQGVTQILRDTQCFERLEHGPMILNLWHVSCWPTLKCILSISFHRGSHGILHCTCCGMATVSV